MTTAATTATECPNCGKKGKAVQPVTLRALLRDEFVGQVANTHYRFCDAQDCDIVYYGSGRVFSTPQLKVAVGVKETAGERPLCYCFGHSIDTIKAELRTKGHSDALADIRQKMAGPGCACEVANPSGSCCLDPVGRGIETAKAELNGTTPGRSKAEAISKAGTVLSAIMASSCCWLPLVLLAFGVSGASIAGPWTPTGLFSSPRRWCASRRRSTSPTGLVGWPRLLKTAALPARTAVPLPARQANADSA